MLRRKNGPICSGVLVEDTRKNLSAFQMYFGPENTDGTPDAETLAIAQVIDDQYRPAPQ